MTGSARPARAVMLTALASAVIAAIAVTAAIAAHLATASAAGLAVAGRDGSRVYAHGASRCAAGPVTVSPSGTPSAGQYTQVTVSGISGTCSAGQIAVVSSTGPYAVRFSGAGTASGGTLVVPGAAFTPPATGSAIALVTIDGWKIPATWSYSPAPSYGALACYPADPSVTASCAVEVTSWSLWEGGYRVNFRVTTTSSTPLRWEVRLDLSRQVDPPSLRGGVPLFPGDPVPPFGSTPSWTPTLFQGENFCAVSTAAELPVVRLRGVAWNRDVSAPSPAGALGLQPQRSGGSPWSSFPLCGP